MTSATEKRPGAGEAGLGLAVQAVIAGRVALLVLVTAMAVIFSGDSRNVDRQFPFGFLLVLSGALALAYRRVAQSGADRRGLLATQFLVDVATVSYLVFFTGGAESQFVPLYLLAPLLGGVFLSVRGGVSLAALSAAAYGSMYAAGRTGLMPAAPYGLTQSLGDEALLLKVSLYVPLMLMVGVIGGLLGRTLREGQRALDDARAELNRALFDTESIVENLSSGLITVDASGVVRHWNRAAGEILGRSGGEVRGQPYGEVLGPGYESFRERLRDALESGGESSRFEATVVTGSDRRVPLGISTSLLGNPDGGRRGVIALFQDLSEVKAREERSRRRETLAAIGELSAGIAHEIRNCLNPISGSVEVLQRELRVKGENARLLDLIVRESERLDNFIRELLEYARERPLKLEALDLGSFLEETAELASRHPGAAATKTVRLRPLDAGVTVEVDAEQMKQVLMNLLINALEAIEESGTVELRVVVGRERRKSRRGGSSEHLACVEIEDTGVGIASQDLELIFEPFFSTKRGGTGLGLAIANRIVERHGGTLEVDSRLGTGTTVRLWIPRVESRARTVTYAA